MRFSPHARVLVHDDGTVLGLAFPGDGRTEHEGGARRLAVLLGVRDLRGVSREHHAVRDRFNDTFPCPDRTGLICEDIATPSGPWTLFGFCALVSDTAEATRTLLATLDRCGADRDDPLPTLDDLAEAADPDFDAPWRSASEDAPEDAPPGEVAEYPAYWWADPQEPHTIAAWSEGGFVFATRDAMSREACRHLVRQLERDRALPVFGRFGFAADLGARSAEAGVLEGQEGPISSEGTLFLLDWEALPSQVQIALKPALPDRAALAAAAEATGIAARLTQAECRTTTLLPGWADLSKRPASRAADETAHPVVFCISPITGRARPGCFTVEELDRWIAGTGPVVRPSWLERQEPHDPARFDVAAYDDHGPTRAAQKAWREFVHAHPGADQPHHTHATQTLSDTERNARYFTAPHLRGGVRAQTILLGLPGETTVTAALRDTQAEERVAVVIAPGQTGMTTAARLACRRTWTAGPPIREEQVFTPQEPDESEPGCDEAWALFAPLLYYAGDEEHLHPPVSASMDARVAWYRRRLQKVLRMRVDGLLVIEDLSKGRAGCVRELLAAFLATPPAERSPLLLLGDETLATELELAALVDPRIAGARLPLRVVPPPPPAAAPDMLDRLHPLFSDARERMGAAAFEALVLESLQNDPCTSVAQFATLIANYFSAVDEYEEISDVASGADLTLSEDLFRLVAASGRGRRFHFV